MPMVPTEAPHVLLAQCRAGGQTASNHRVLSLAQLEGIQQTDQERLFARWVVDGEGNKRTRQRRGRDKKVTKTAGCETSHPDVIFHSSSILDPATIWASSSPAPVTCVHPASCRASLALLSGLPWPWKRHMETSSVQKTSVGNVVPCRLRLAARVAQTRSHFQRLRDGGRCNEMITSPI